MSESLPPPTPRSKRAMMVALVATIILTALDLGSKAWALEELSAPRSTPLETVCEPNTRGFTPYQRNILAPKVLIDGVLEFRYAENCGAAFGVLRDASWRRYIFYPAAIFAILLLPWMFYRGRSGPWFAWAVPFIVAGAIGNLHDRIVHGYVVDFIRFYLRDGFWFIGPGWEYPTFNVADIHITVGVIMILIDGFAEARKERQAAREAAAAEAEAEAAAPAEVASEPDAL